MEATAQIRDHDPSAESLRGRRSDAARCAARFAGVAMDALALPFDTARAQYARAAQVGLIERSMLAHREFERTLGAWERLCLGPWARRQ